MTAGRLRCEVPLAMLLNVATLPLLFVALLAI
jgi:hypothetical protein